MNSCKLIKLLLKIGKFVNIDIPNIGNYYIRVNFQCTGKDHILFVGNSKRMCTDSSTSKTAGGGKQTCVLSRIFHISQPRQIAELNELHFVEMYAVGWNPIESWLQLSKSQLTLEIELYFKSTTGFKLSKRCICGDKEDGQNLEEEKLPAPYRQFLCVSRTRYFVPFLDLIIYGGVNESFSDVFRGLCDISFFGIPVGTVAPPARLKTQIQGSVLATKQPTQLEQNMFWMNASFLELKEGEIEESQGDKIRAGQEEIVRTLPGLVQVLNVLWELLLLRANYTVVMSVIRKLYPEGGARGGGEGSDSEDSQEGPEVGGGKESGLFKIDPAREQELFFGDDIVFSQPPTSREWPQRSSTTTRTLRNDGWKVLLSEARSVRKAFDARREAIRSIRKKLNRLFGIFLNTFAEGRKPGASATLHERLIMMGERHHEKYTRTTVRTIELCGDRFVYDDHEVVFSACLPAHVGAADQGGGKDTGEGDKKKAKDSKMVVDNVVKLSQDIGVYKDGGLLLESRRSVLAFEVQRHRKVAAERVKALLLTRRFLLSAFASSRDVELLVRVLCLGRTTAVMANHLREGDMGLLVVNTKRLYVVGRGCRKGKGKKRKRDKDKDKGQTQSQCQYQGGKDNHTARRIVGNVLGVGTGGTGVGGGGGGREGGERKGNEGAQLTRCVGAINSRWSRKSNRPEKSWASSPFIALAVSSICSGLPDPVDGLGIKMCDVWQAVSRFLDVRKLLCDDKGRCDDLNSLLEERGTEGEGGGAKKRKGEKRERERERRFVNMTSIMSFPYSKQASPLSQSSTSTGVKTTETDSSNGNKSVSEDTGEKSRGHKGAKQRQRERQRQSRPNLSHSPKYVKLHVFFHGFMGRPEDMTGLENAIRIRAHQRQEAEPHTDQEERKTANFYLRSCSNQANSSASIAHQAKRAAREILACIQRLGLVADSHGRQGGGRGVVYPPALLEINFYGHSLGGLVARLVVERPEFEPMRQHLNRLMCINTPNLGTLCSGKLVRNVANLCCGMKGKQSLADMGDISSSGVLAVLARSHLSMSAFKKVVLVSVLGDSYSGLSSSLICGVSGENVKKTQQGEGGTRKFKHTQYTKLMKQQQKSINKTIVQRIIVAYGPQACHAGNSSVGRLLHTHVMVDREALGRLAVVADL